MFSSADQPHFTQALEGADFQVLAFKSRETLNTPFAFELELVSEQAFLDLEKLLHKEAFWQISTSGTGIHRQVYSISRGNAGRRLTRLNLMFVFCLTTKKTPRTLSPSRKEKSV